MRWATPRTATASTSSCHDSRNDPARRLDEESNLDRRFVLPDDRAFLLSGTARVNPNATDAVLDDAFGTTAPGTTFTSSSHLFGDADARASRAFDHDPDDRVDTGAR